MTGTCPECNRHCIGRRKDDPPRFEFYCVCGFAWSELVGELEAAA